MAERPQTCRRKIIGSAYALIFRIQNIGLWLFPLLIGKVLDSTNADIVAAVKDGTMTAEQAAVSYDYTWPLVMLARLGVAALVLGLYLKVVDRKSISASNCRTSNLTLRLKKPRWRLRRSVMQ